MASEGAAVASLLRPIRGQLSAAVAAQAAAAVVSVVPFVAVAELGRTLLAEGPVDQARVWTIVAVAAAGLLVRLLLLVISGAISHLGDNALQLDIRRRLVARLGRVPLGWFSARNSGVVKKAVQDEVHAMHHMVAHSLLELTAAVIGPLVSLVYLAWVDWRMTLVMIVPVVLGMIGMGRTVAGFKKHMPAVDAANERISGSVVEFVRGIAVVKTFGEARRAHRRFADAADDFARFFQSWIGSLVAGRSLAEILLSPVVMLLAVLVGGAVFVTGGTMSPADLLPFALLGVGLPAPFLALSYAEEHMRTARAAAGRIVALLNTEELVVTGSPLAPADNRVVFTGVTFSYQDGEDVLRGVDLVLEPGTVTALVGDSGAGKSTLATLLPRFWDVTGGSITIGGVDLRSMAPEELYRRVSFVFQDVQLLRDTVADNIRLARPDASHAEVVAAARRAQIHDRVERLPRGYDSVVGEDALFSGGEAQRLSIARALLAEAPVIVLDEATVYTDPENEAAVQDAVSELVGDRTLLVIAHRLATVVNADQIVVLDEGRIAERGTHQELLAAGGRYARMWESHERSSRWQPHEGFTTSTAGEVVR